ncbi:MAG TPA: DUF883 family protein [Burkholderiales bacterium]|nr:DUF883 family protein [Burkholderiales bacterium]
MGKQQEGAMQSVSTEKLMNDLHAVVDDTEELLKATAAQTGESIEKLRARATESLNAARARLREAGESRVHQQPWTSLGVVAGIAFLLGMLLGGRHED